MEKDGEGNLGGKLLAAAVSGDAAAIGLLIAAGADLEAKDDVAGRTASLWAAFHGHEACMKLLIDAGARIEAKDEHGWTAFMIAANQGHEACVDRLIGQGADLDAKSAAGMTASILATAHGYAALASLIEGVLLSRLETGQLREAAEKAKPGLPRGPRL